MIVKLIGKKRTILMSVLLAINAVLGGIYFGVAGPMESETVASIEATRGEISGLQGKIQNIKKEVEEYKTNLPIYENLASSGFLKDQDRFEVVKIMDEIGAKSRFEKFAYTIEDMKNIPNNDALKVKMDLVVSTIAVDNVMLYLDTDLFDFIARMQKEFPAQLRLSSFTLKRNLNYEKDVLLRMAKRQELGFITANVSFDWMTLIKRPDAEGNSPGTGGGGASGGTPDTGAGMGGGATAPSMMGE